MAENESHRDFERSLRRAASTLLDEVEAMRRRGFKTEEIRERLLAVGIPAEAVSLLLDHQDEAPSPEALAVYRRLQRHDHQN